MNLIDALILSLVEAFTEFFPISSTGHLILTSHFLGLGEDESQKAFNIVIQLGAVLAVIVKERKILTDKKWLLLLLVSFIPTGLIGFLLKNKLNFLLDNVHVVGWSLLLGGVLFLFIEKVFRAHSKVLSDMDYKDGATVGLFQCLALIPGVSRSAASMLAGRGLGYSREDASRFSFLLAIPTLGAASLYKSKDLFQTGSSVSPSILIVSLIVCFIASLLALQSCQAVVKRFGFAPFGVYRIIVGLFILFYL